MDAQEPEGPEAGNLRFLRRMVTVLTAIMIVGVLTVVVLLVIRLGAAPKLAIPDHIDLPAGAEAIAVTRTTDALIVLTADGRVLQYDNTGKLMGEAKLSPPSQ